PLHNLAGTKHIFPIYEVYESNLHLNITFICRFLFLMNYTVFRSIEHIRIWVKCSLARGLVQLHNLTYKTYLSSTIFETYLRCWLNYGSGPFPDYIQNHKNIYIYIYTQTHTTKL
ncbi:hypothetical protein TorRG33x02_148940, partial [Trema orientale]